MLQHLKYGSFGIGYGIGRKYQPIWVSVVDLNQISGFGRSLLTEILFLFMSVFLPFLDFFHLKRKEPQEPFFLKKVQDQQKLISGVCQLYLFSIPIYFLLTCLFHNFY